MRELVAKALELWDGDVAAQQHALDRFREIYAEPVRVNGTATPVSEMVGRARALGEAFTDRRTVLHDMVEGDGFVAIAFEIHARHTGTWPSAAGPIAATGHEVVVQGMDIFRLDAAGKVAVVWAVNDLGDALTRMS